MSLKNFPKSIQPGILLLPVLLAMLFIFPSSGLTVLAGGPVPPTPLSPGYGWLITADNVTAGAHAYPPVAVPEFEWTAVDGATNYRLQISNNIAFTTVAQDVTTPNTTYTPTNAGLFADGTWYWRVRVDGSPDGPSDYSSPMEFTKQWATLDNKPTLVEPMDFATIEFYDRPIFSWRSAMGAASYRLEIDNTSDFTSLVYSAVTVATNDTTTNPTMHQPLTKLANGTYYWRVVPIDPANRNGTPSDYRQFDLNYAQIPALIAPADGANPTFTPTFRWEAVRGAQFYRLQYTTDSSFSSGITQVDTRNTTWTPTITIANDVDYYWRVKAVSGTSESDWSPARRFLKKWYIQARLLTPTNNYQDQYMPPLFNWAPVPGAARYRIQIDNAPDFSSLLYSADVANTFYTPSGSVWNTGIDPIIYWRVIPLDGDGKLGLASQTFSFVKDNSAYSPELIYPFYYYDPTVTDPNTGGNVAYSPVEDRTVAYPLFVWHRAVDTVDGYYAPAYRIQVDDDPNFTSVDWQYDTETTNAVPTSSYPFTPQQGVIYYWRVRGLTGLGGAAYTEWSQSWATRFDTSVGLPPTVTGLPQLLRPTHEEEQAEYTPRFDWFPYNNATGYEIQISRDEAFTEIVDSASVPYPSYAPRNALASRAHNELEFGTFYWRVRAMNGATPLTNWSTPWRFQIAATSQWIRAAGTGRATNFKIGSDADDQGDNNYELTGLFATQSQNYWNFGINATTAAANMTYAFYLDSNYADGSGATTDACGYNLTAITSHRPEYILYVRQIGSAFNANNTALYSWNPSTNQWNALVQSLAAVGGSLSFGSSFLEVQIPNTAIGFNQDQGGFNVAVASFQGSVCPSAGTGPVDIVPDNTGATGNVIDRFSAVTDRAQLVFPFNTLAGDPTTYPSVLPFAVEYPAGFDPTPLGQPDWTVGGPLSTDDSVISEGLESGESPLSPLDAGSPWSGGRNEIYLDPLYTTMVQFQVLVCNCQYFNWQSFTNSNDIQGDNSYYWRFRTRFYDGVESFGSFSEGFRFNREGFIPENLAHSVSFATPTFSWNIVEGASSYVIQVDNDPTFASPNINQTTRQNTYTPPDTLDNGTYYWRVRIARDGGINNDWSPSQTFTLSKPVPVNLVHYPVTANGVVDRAPTFCWDVLIARDSENIPVLAAWKYRLQYSLDSSFSTGVTAIETEQNCYTPMVGMNDGTYYWRVAMLDGNSRVGEYTPTASVVKQYPITTLIYPLTGTGLTTTPTFEWSVVKGAKSYRFEVSQTPTFASLYDSVTTDNVHYTPIRKYPYGVYYWRVAIVDKDGKIGPFNNATIILDETGFGFRLYIPLARR